MKKRNLFLIGIISIFLLCLTTLVVGNIISNNALKKHIQETTTPLSNETIEYLCGAFKLTAEDKLCNGQVDVYGPDFYPVIGEIFYPTARDGDISTNPADYNYVEQTLGRFKTDCEPITGKDNYQHFRCHYDLRGDGSFKIGIYFSYPDMKVYNIQTPMGMD
jgi:hypothetical protein